MDFPRFVFRCPGKNSCNGGTHDQVLVENESEHEAAIAAGYFPTLPEALKAPVTKDPEAENESEHEAPDTITKPKASTQRAPRQAQRKR